MSKSSEPATVVATNSENALLLIDDDQEAEEGDDDAKTKRKALQEMRKAGAKMPEGPGWVCLVDPGSMAIGALSIFSGFFLDVKFGFGGQGRRRRAELEERRREQERLAAQWKKGEE